METTVVPLDEVTDLVGFLPPLAEEELISLVHEWRQRHADRARLTRIHMGSEAVKDWVQAYPPESRRLAPADRTEAFDEEALIEKGLGTPGVDAVVEVCFFLPPGWLVLEGAREART